MKNVPTIDLAALKLRGDALSVSILSPNTRKARASDWSLFSRWCVEAGRVAMPASVETVCLYATYCLECGLSVRTVAQRRCTISCEHKDRDLPSPVGPAVCRIYRGARRDQTRKKSRGPKDAFSSADLLAISGALGSTARDIRDRCVMVFGFHLLHLKRPPEGTGAVWTSDAGFSTSPNQAARLGPPSPLG
jgi:hypothetical protein